MSSYQERITRAQKLMQEQGVDWLIVSVSSDLRYLIGYNARPSERLNCLMVPQKGPATMLLPHFELLKLRETGVPASFAVASWQETEDPIAVAANIIGKDTCTIAVAEQMWSTFLLKLQAEMPRAGWTSAAPVMVPLRMRKDAEEMAHLFEVGRRMDRVYADVRDLRFAGKTEAQMGEAISQLVKDHGLSPTRSGGVASGPNSASPHHNSSHRVIQNGDSIWIELGQGGSFKGYVADKTRPVHVGPPSEEYLHAHEVVRIAQEKARKSVRIGMPCQDVDRIARRIIQDGGLGEYFTHRVGHGLGLDSHEHPYMVEGNTTPIEVGMVFSVEPGVYLPGRFGLRIEDIMVVTPDGARSIYESTRELVIVE